MIARSAAGRLICRVFHHSPVFRIGGDEFAVIIRNEDYENRNELTEQFKASRAELCASAENKWDEPRIAMGVVVFDPAADISVDEVMRRADKLMYENKRSGKIEYKRSHK